MENEQKKKPYTAPAFEVIEMPNRTDILLCSKTNTNCLEELGLADSTKEYWA